MGLIKKAFKSAGKAVKKTVKSVTKVVKKVASTVTNVVKKVAKSVVKVGKSIVKGIGKISAKLGPLASIALMAIPGFQAFGASLASGLGFTSTFAAKVATGALTGFLTSGGDLKAAAMGGVMAGAGSYLGDVAKGAMSAGSLSEGFSFASSEAMKNSITGGLTGMEGFKAGLSQAKTDFSNFTNKVSNFLTGNGTTDITTGTAQHVQADKLMTDNPNMSYEEALIKSQSTVPSVEVVDEMYVAGTDQPFSPKTQAISTDWGADVQAAQDSYYSNLVPDTTLKPVDNFANIKTGRLYNELMKTGYDPTLLSEEMAMFDSPLEKANWLEYQYAQVTDPLTASNVYTPQQWAEGMKQQATYNVGAATTMGTTPEAMAQRMQMQTTQQQPKEDDTLKKLAKGIGKSLLGGSGQEATKAAFPYTTSVEAGDLSLASAGAVGGAGGTLGFTDVIRQHQGLLVSQAERQAELAREKARKGWSIA